MGLAETQRALARLYTDGPLRARFFADPAGVGGELGLSDEEAGRVAELSARQVQSFAASLVGKRRREAEKLLPRTSEVMGRRFHAEFIRYAVTPIPDGVQRHREDALAFSRFLRQRGQAQEPAWAWDLLRYETAWLEAADPKRRCLVRVFRFNVGQAPTEATVHVARRLTLGLWLRLGQAGPLRHWLLPLGPGIIGA